MDKLRLDFAVKPTDEGKSNMICITSIATPDGNIFGIPLESQPAGLHKEIVNTPNYVKVKKTLTKRYQTRKIWIALTEDISKVYLDTEQNIQFNDIYLEIMEKKITTKSIDSDSNPTLEKLLEKLIENKQTKSETQNLGIIAKDFNLEKFNGKNTNAKQWNENFNTECERFQIKEDKKKIEILKHVLECSSLELYGCMLIKFTVESKWDTWEKNVCNTFANKGWSPIRYALAFKYQVGSLLEYALKKKNYYWNTYRPYSIWFTKLCG